MKKTVKKRKIGIVNKFKFIRFIVCCILLITFVIYSCFNITNKINKQEEHIETIQYVEEITDEITESIQYVEVVDEIEDLGTSQISKPDGLDDTYYNWMIEISEKENIPLEVILAIVTTENITYDANSTYKNDNGSMDMGMCQINSAYVDYYAEKYNITNLNPYNVYDAVTFVARHMKYLSNYAITKYGLSEMDSYIFAAGAYNRGLSNECKYRNMYHYKEKFLNNYNKFI